jgi:hypothetical protein
MICFSFAVVLPRVKVKAPLKNLSFRSHRFFNLIARERTEFSRHPEKSERN